MGVGIIIPKKPLLSILCGGIIFIASILFKFLSQKGQSMLEPDVDDTDVDKEDCKEVSRGQSGRSWQKMDEHISWWGQSGLA